MMFIAYSILCNIHSWLQIDIFILFAIFIRDWWLIYSSSNTCFLIHNCARDKSFLTPNKVTIVWQLQYIAWAQAWRWLTWIFPLNWMCDTICRTTSDELGSSDAVRIGSCRTPCLLPSLPERSARVMPLGMFVCLSVCMSLCVCVSVCLLGKKRDIIMFVLDFPATRREIM